MLALHTKVVVRHLPSINAMREGDVGTIVGELTHRAYYGWWTHPDKAAWLPTYIIDSPKGMLTIHAICAYPLEGESNGNE